MNNISNSLKNRHIGILMIISDILMILAMSLHPQGVSQDTYQTTIMKWVHGTLIFLLVFNAFGLERLVEHLKSNDQDTSLGMMFYYVGLGSFIGAALVSGFVQTSLAYNLSADTEIFLSLNRFSSILNQALARLGIISFGTAVLFLSTALIRDGRISRFLAAVSFFVGASLIVSIFSVFSLSVFTMTLFAVLIAMWHVAIGFWLTKN